MRIDTSTWSPQQQKVWAGLPEQKKTELGQEGPAKALGWVNQQLSQGTMHLRGTVGAGKMTGRGDKIRGSAEQQPTPQAAPELLASFKQQLTQGLLRVATGAEAQAPAQLQPLTIGGSVGARGANRPDDVAQVQHNLSALGLLGEGFTPGQMDQATIDAITQYQQQSGLKVVDGRIDVGKATMRHMNRQIDQGQSPTARGGQRPAAPSTRIPMAPSGPSPAPAPAGTPDPAPAGTPDPAPVAPVRGGPIAPANDAQLQALQQRAVTSAQGEWQAGVREEGRSNRSERVDHYARTARMNPGGEWCGYFTGFNYAQNGFKHTPSLASYQKARDFFMYRSYTSKTGSDTNDNLDNLRAQHQANGDGRQYFMLEESPNINRVTRNGPWGNQRYGHYDAQANTFNYQSLPVRGGDTVLFHRGHVGMVESYNPATGILTTIEGNARGETADGRTRSGSVVRKTYDLKDPAVRAQFDGFGRPALDDFATGS